MSFEIKGAAELIAKLRRIKADLERADYLEVIAQDLIAMITTRVQGGHGISGTMKAYSANYALYRAKKGRQIGHRDLNFEGNMLASMGVIDRRKGGRTIGFKSEAERIKALANQRISPWFGLTIAEKAFVAKRIEQEISKIVGK